MSVEIDALDLKGHLKTMYDEANAIELEAKIMLGRAEEVRKQAGKLKAEFNSKLALLDKKRS